MFSRLKNLINKTNDANNDPQQTSSVMTEEELQRRQRAMADQKRREVEQEYQQEHPDQIREEKELSFENKTNKLKKKLNIAIITVFGLIIIVFLILFFI